MQAVTLVVVMVMWLVNAADDATPSKDVEIIEPKTRSLFVRNIPGIFGQGSGLYGIPGRPYHFDFQPLMALAVLRGGGGEAEGGSCGGEILFTQPSASAPVLVTGNVTGLSAGFHGFHVHVKGDLREGCVSAGPHFNPFLQQHGAPRDMVRHVGDLGNIKAEDDGLAKVEFLDPIISLQGGPRCIVGRTLIVHMAQDDYGHGHDEESARTGNAGASICCGIIGYLN